MAKRRLALELAALEGDIIETLLAGLHEWRPDLAYPESHSDMQGAVRGLLRMFDVRRRPLAVELSYAADTPIKPQVASKQPKVENSEDAENERELLLWADDVHNSPIKKIALLALKYRAERDELQKTFDFRWDADMRAIKQWHDAGGDELTWPDHADMVVWLLEQLEKAPQNARKPTNESG